MSVGKGKITFTFDLVTNCADIWADDLEKALRETIEFKIIMREGQGDKFTVKVEQN